MLQNFLPFTRQLINARYYAKVLIFVIYSSQQPCELDVNLHFAEAKTGGVKDMT